MGGGCTEDKVSIRVQLHGVVGSYFEHCRSKSCQRPENSAAAALSYSSVDNAKLYDRKTFVTVADILNDR